MKYSLVNGERSEAQPGLKGQCPTCGNTTTAKCGEVKIWHWSRKGKRMCDPWWENETEWHRNLKNCFPDDWQEVRHLSSSGELHIADVKTDQDFVLEFQHSYLQPEERNARQDFYKKLIWVVDARKQKRDQAKFISLLNRGMQVKKGIPMLALIGALDKCALLRDWAGSPAPIFFDFDEPSTLWYLIPHSTVRLAYVIKFSKEYFIQLHRGGTKINQELEFWFNELNKLVLDYTSMLRTQNQLIPQP